MRDAHGHLRDLPQYLGTAVELLEAIPMVAYAATLRVKKPEPLAVMVMMTGSMGIVVEHQEQPIQIMP